MVLARQTSPATMIDRDGWLRRCALNYHVRRDSKSLGNQPLTGIYVKLEDQIYAWVLIMAEYSSKESISGMSK